MVGRPDIPWGEIAHALAGKPGYERVRRRDEKRVAPGAETLRALFGDAPTLIVADRMAESVSARKATLLDPTEDDETVQVLRRRLFEHIDDAGAAKVVDAYRGLWAGHQDALADDAARPETAERFRASYPLHPHVLDTLTGKTATLDNFQRVRGMLRLLARTIAHLWRHGPPTRRRFICITSIPATSRSGRRS